MNRTASKLFPHHNSLCERLPTPRNRQGVPLPPRGGTMDETYDGGIHDEGHAHTQGTHLGDLSHQQTKVLFVVGREAAKRLSLTKV